MSNGLCTVPAARALTIALSRSTSILCAVHTTTGMHRVPVGAAHLLCRGGTLQGDDTISGILKQDAYNLADSDIVLDDHHNRNRVRFVGRHFRGLHRASCIVEGAIARVAPRERQRMHLGRIRLHPCGGEPSGWPWKGGW